MCFNGYDLQEYASVQHCSSPLVSISTKVSVKTTPANFPILNTAAPIALMSSASRSMTTSYLPKVGNIRFTPSILLRKSTTSSNLPCAVLMRTHAESKQSTSLLITVEIVNKQHFLGQRFALIENCFLAIKFDEF